MSDVADVPDLSRLFPLPRCAVVVFLNLKYLFTESMLPPIVMHGMRAAAIQTQLPKPQLGLPPNNVVVKGSRNPSVCAENMLARCLMIADSPILKTNGSQCFPTSRTAN